MYEQSASAMEAYHEFWANALLPYSEYLWMAVILVIALTALWQARIFVSKF